jgi:adenine-specific DNA-methyltransferase
MTQTDNSARFRALLAELLMLDQADLDFGIYRTMNARRAEIMRFLDEDLLPQIHEELRRNQTGDREALERQLAEAIEAARTAGFDQAQAENAPKARELRAKLNDALDVPRAEREVFNHLYNFFSRYYQEGDFLSLRRYKRDVYALPYEGEEVKLHWANADQYYIKTSEFFRNYSFTVAGGRRVHFKLATADTEQNNNKATSERERRFMLASAPDFLRVENDELIVNFVYQPDVEKRKQADINREAVRAVFDALGAGAPPAPKKAAKKGRKKKGGEEVAVATASEATTGAVNTELLAWAKALMQPVGTNGNPERTTLEKHLNDYTAKNSFDYFIHKDLSGFLRRELDFYIKNEVMFLDDIERESAPRVENYLAVVRAIRRVGLKIIEFLASLEDFQKRLWLKKKFVIETHWCVTLDRVPEEFYAEVAANERQRAEWVRLFAINEINGNLHDAAYSEPLTVEFLRSQPHLILDTSLFDRDFTERLLATFDDVEEQTDGVLIESENFQALNLLQARYREQVKCIYIDPPYNSDASPINYKNGYRDSSWISLVENRLQLTSKFLEDSGILCVTIDDYEAHYLRMACERTLLNFELLGVAVIKNNPAGRTGTVGFSITHEYAFFYGDPEAADVNRLEHSEEQKARYKEKDEKGFFEWTNFRKHGGLNTYRIARPRQFYPIYVQGQSIRIPSMTWDNDSRQYVIHEQSSDGEEVLLPIDNQGRERIWDFVVETARKNINHFLVKKDANGETAIYRKWYINEEGLLPQTWWDKSLYSAAEYGTNLLTALFGVPHTFMFPKSVHAVADCLKVGGLRNDRTGFALDYFGGSGTTAHAIINLNREDEGRRKFILVEMGEYFHTVTKPRVLKVIYSRDWRDGKPVSRAGSSCLIKILRLESYEDALNNLTVTRTSQQSDLLALNDTFREQYTLRYLFERETASSASLLNLDLFENPFDYRLNVSAGGSSAGSVSTSVDLIETFNYLLGLRVARRYTRDGFRVVEGADADGSRTLIIWRNAREQDNAALNRFFTKQGYGARGFHLVYANGDHTLGMTRREGETWQDRIIEMDFKRLMFEEAA